MTMRTVTAMFKSRSEAESAAQRLASDLRLNRATIRISPETEASDTARGQAGAYEEKGFFASLRDLFIPDEDRYAYAEGMRRGSVLLSAQVDEANLGRASEILEHEGAIDLDEQEADWRQSGWSGYDPAAHQSARGASQGLAGTAPATTAGKTPAPVTQATAGAAQANSDETLKVVQERLHVGKRDVEGGRVRVRAYVVERPVEEQVHLHDERVEIDRRPVDRAATDADLAAFQERTIEARAHSEEAVVSKEARVVEEIGLRREGSDRVETVRDTVRETKVDVEDGRTGKPGAAAADRARNTDGTPGNPPGTMASRGIDRTLGTNVSGANPNRT